VSYRATVSREGEYWLAEVPDLPGAHAYARTLYRLRREITDAIILAADLADETAVDVEFVLTSDDEQLREALALAKRRQDLAHEQASIAARMATVAAEAVAAGWSVRDVAGALGITAGRVSQLTSAAKPPSDHSRGRRRGDDLPRGQTMAAKFEVYQSGSQYRFRLKAANGEIVASSEAYESKAGAHEGCEAVKRAAAAAMIEAV